MKNSQVNNRTDTGRKCLIAEKKRGKTLLSLLKKLSVIFGRKNTEALPFADTSELNPGQYNFHSKIIGNTYDLESRN